MSAQTVFEYSEERGAKAFQEELNRLREQARHTEDKNDDVFHMLRFLSERGFEADY